METNLLDKMLNGYLSDGTAVTISLQNKIRITGTIKSFDSYVIILANQNHKDEIVYRHAVSSLAAHVQEQPKQSIPRKPAQAQPEARHVKPFSKDRNGRPPRAALPKNEDSRINSSMKDGLMKWMQGQKAAK